MADRTAIQNIQLTGRLTYMKLKEKETVGENNKVIQKITFGMQLNNRTSVFIESTLWNMNNPAPFTQQKLKEYMYILDRFNSGEDVYISTSIKPNWKDGKMFDKLSMYEKKDGTIGMNVQASVNYRKHILDENNVPIITFDTKNSSFEKLFTDCHPKFTFEMVVEETEGQFIQLTDGQDYPTRVIGRLPDHIPNMARVGQGYQFIGELKKGQRIDRPVASAHAWDDEAKTVAEFEPDYMVLTPAGIIKELTLDIIEKAEPQREGEKLKKELGIQTSSNSSSDIANKPSKIGEDSELPF